MLKIFLITNIYLMANTFANTNMPYCKLEDSSAEKILKINDIPSYFYKVHPDGRFISFIGQKGNRLLDFETGRIIPLPGSVDPVFTSDGNFLSIPMFKDEYSGPITPGDQVKLYDGTNLSMQRARMTFYDFLPFKERITNKKSKDYAKNEFQNYSFSDNDNYGVYQSVAKVSQNTYRLISDKNGISVRHYKLNQSGKFETFDKLHVPCSNINNLPTDLPIISKDGQFFSVNNTITRSTQIYEINEQDECHLSLDLGITTGKVSFNFDSTKIAFHMDHFNQSTGGYFSGTPSDVIRDVYAVELKKEKNDLGFTNLIPTKWSKISNNEYFGNGSYYPEFNKSDDIYYLSDINNYFQFSKISFNKLNFHPFVDFYNIVNLKNIENTNQEIDLKTSAQMLIGEIWSETCNENFNSNPKDNLFMANSLSNENCKQLVQNHFNNDRRILFVNKLSKTIKVNEEFKNISKEKLQEFCDNKTTTQVTSSTYGQWKPRTNAKFQDIIKQKCLSCHSKTIDYEKEIYAKAFYNENGKLLNTEMAKVKKSMPPINLKNIDIRFANKILTAVSEKDPKKRMPKGSNLRASEIQVIHEFTKALELEAKLNEQKQTYDVPISIYTYSDEKIQSLLSDFKQMLSPKLANADKAKQFMRYKREILCQYKQIGCSELIEEIMRDKIIKIKDTNPNLTQSTWNEMQQKEELALKCKFGFEVLYSQCNNYR